MKRFFSKFARKHSSKVTPANLPETSPDEGKPTLSVQVDEVSPVQAFVPLEDPSDNADLDNFDPQIQLTEDSQVQELEPEAISEPEENQSETEEVSIRKMAMRSLVSDLIQRIIEKSGRSGYPPEKRNTIVDCLFEKLWIETEAKVLSMSPERITRQGKAIFKDLIRECSKAENILLLLESQKPIFEKNILSTIRNRLQTRWNSLSLIKEAFKEATENLRENQHRLYIWI